MASLILDKWNFAKIKADLKQNIQENVFSFN